MKLTSSSFFKSPHRGYSVDLDSSEDQQALPSLEERKVQRSFFSPNTYSNYEMMEDLQKFFKK